MCTGGCEKMKEGFLFCVCQGTCPSFAKENAYEITNMVRKNYNVEFAAIHPQLCADDGDRFLKNLLKGTDLDVLYVAGCDPVMQTKMFKDSFLAAGFDGSKLVGADVRNKTTDEVKAQISELIEKTRKARQK
jgi:heterodisulfide reductase subunit A-like polyferredoxin